MTIPNEKMLHVLSVARKMREITEESKDVVAFTPEEAYTVGMVHDIGYEFTDSLMFHGIVGGNILKSTGFKYWQEVYCHGMLQNMYQSDMLDLLNYADLCVGPKGQIWTMEERLKDIERRYGTRSAQYTTCLHLYTELKEKYNT